MGKWLNGPVASVTTAGQIIGNDLIRNLITKISL